MRCARRISASGVEPRHGVPALLAGAAADTSSLEVVPAKSPPQSHLQPHDRHSMQARPSRKRSTRDRVSSLAERVAVRIDGSGTTGGAR